MKLLENLNQAGILKQNPKRQGAHWSEENEEQRFRVQVGDYRAFTHFSYYSYMPQIHKKKKVAKIAIVERYLQVPFAVCHMPCRKHRKLVKEGDLVRRPRLNTATHYAWHVNHMMKHCGSIMSWECFFFYCRNSKDGQTSKCGWSYILKGESPNSNTKIDPTVKLRKLTVHRWYSSCLIEI